jgi:hypothetical protein
MRIDGPLGVPSIHTKVCGFFLAHPIPTLLTL